MVSATPVLGLTEDPCSLTIVLFSSRLFSILYTKLEVRDKGRALRICQEVVLGLGSGTMRVCGGTGHPSMLNLSSVLAALTP